VVIVECVTCKRPIVRHEDNWAEFTLTVHQGDDEGLPFSRQSCNDARCVETMCAGLGLAVLKVVGTR
jgi:hypothetical protein